MGEINFKFNKLPLKDAYLIEAKSFSDNRGYFRKIFSSKEFAKIDFSHKIVQANYTFSKKVGTVRGLHFQKPPFAEAKLVTCLFGKIFDCLIDLRKNSPTFLRWHGEVLSAENNRLVYIPEGFAHGLETLSPNAGILYFHTNSYSPSAEGRIRYDDPRLNIRWPKKITVVSAKDRQNPYLTDDFRGLNI